MKMINLETFFKRKKKKKKKKKGKNRDRAAEFYL